MPNVTEKDKRRNLTEIGALKLCRHPNVVEFFGAYVPRLCLAPLV